MKSTLAPKPHTPSVSRHAAMTPGRLTLILAVIGLLGLGGGLACGSDGCLSPLGEVDSLIASIRLPRTLGAWLTGAALGLAGAIAQGLFRNPLADPYLLGSASGAHLAVTAALAASAALGIDRIGLDGATALSGLSSLLGTVGLSGAAFIGALVGTLLTVLLAGGAKRPIAMLLAGVVVGMLLGAVSDLVSLFAPQALRARQAFALGSTSLIDWTGVALLLVSVLVALSLSVAHARVLDALSLGEQTASSLGMNVGSHRIMLIAALTLATGVAVAQAGLIGFVGLAAPHVVRRVLPVTHRSLLLGSSLCGGALLLWADVVARSAWAPRELPVGLITALLGGSYLLVLLHRRTRNVSLP